MKRSEKRATAGQTKCALSESPQPEKLARALLIQCLSPNDNPTKLDSPPIMGGPVMTILSRTLFIFSLLIHAAQGETRRPLIVVMGGWDSCGKSSDPMPPRHSMLFADAAKCYVGDAWPGGGGSGGENASTIYSCYTGDTNPRKAEFRFGREGATPTSVKTGNPDAVIKQFSDYVKSQAGGREILIIGHSHGGWSAMRTALHLPTERASFISLDPVSRVECPPNVVQIALGGVARKEGLKIPPGCGGFPPDIDEESLRRLFHSGRKVALNVYAGGDSNGAPRALPHSGLVAMGPDTNGNRVNYRVMAPKIDSSDRRDAIMSGPGYDPARALAHQAVERDPRTWTEVRSRIESGYGVTLGKCSKYGGPPQPSTLSLIRAGAARLAKPLLASH